MGAASRNRWWRFGAAGLALVGAYWSTSATMARVVVKSNPMLAHRLAPGDGQITARYAQFLLYGESSGTRTSGAESAARQALIQDATAVDALSVLGLRSQIAGQDDAARRYFGYSLRMSRRELQPRLWAIEEAVARGDIDGALSHYDLALRTSRTASQVLFPPLATALSEPLVLDRIVALLLGRDPPWRRDFLTYASLSAPDPTSVASFMEKAQAAGIEIPEAERANLVNALARKGMWQEAWTSLTSYRKGLARNRSRDPRFMRGTLASTTFDWSVIDQNGVSSAIVPGRTEGSFEFSAAPSAGGTVLTQSLLLPSGRYILRGRSADVAIGDGARPYWSVTCIDGRQIGRITVPDSAANGGRFAGPVVVPASCVTQFVTFVVQPSDSISGITGRILEAAILPEG